MLAEPLLRDVGDDPGEVHHALDTRRGRGLGEDAGALGVTGAEVGAAHAVHEVEDRVDVRQASLTCSGSITSMTRVSTRSSHHGPVRGLPRCGGSGTAGSTSPRRRDPGRAGPGRDVPRRSLRLRSPTRAWTQPLPGAAADGGTGSGETAGPWSVTLPEPVTRVPPSVAPEGGRRGSTHPLMRLHLLPQEGQYASPQRMDMPLVPTPNRGSMARVGRSAVISPGSRWVEPRGLEPLTPCLQSRCATNCAMAPGWPRGAGRSAALDLVGGLGPEGLLVLAAVDLLRARRRRRRRPRGAGSSSSSDPSGGCSGGWWA